MPLILESRKTNPNLDVTDISYKDVEEGHYHDILRLRLASQRLTIARNQRLIHTLEMVITAMGVAFIVAALYVLSAWPR